MISAEEYLDFDFSAPAFATNALNILTKQNQRDIDRAISENETVASHCSNYDVKIPDMTLVSDIVKRFKVHYKDAKVKDMFSIRELRILTYALHEFKDREVLLAVIQTMNKKWKNSFVNGLVFSLLNGWLGFNDVSKEYIYKLLEHNIKGYKGTRKKLNLIKRHLRYLNYDGASALGKDLNINNVFGDKMSLLKASTHYFGMKDDKINLPYYSDVITSLYADGPLTNYYDEITKILDAHNNQRTDKILIPRMVLEIQYRSGSIVEKVKDLALRRIGAPEIDSLWRIVDGTLEQKMRIANAQKILNRWVIEKFITIFFDRIYEPQRKQFWLQHIDIIDDFRIYAPWSVRYSLQKDKRITEQLYDIHVKKIIQDTSSNECVLVFYIGNYYITEFSNTGSIYAYRKDNHGRNMMTDTIYNAGDLKKSWLPSLAPVDGGYVYHYHEEGRMVHVGYWQSRMNNWLKRFI